MTQHNSASRKDTIEVCPRCGATRHNDRRMGHPQPFRPAEPCSHAWHDRKVLGYLRKRELVERDRKAK